MMTIMTMVMTCNDDDNDVVMMTIMTMVMTCYDGDNDDGNDVL